MIDEELYRETFSRLRASDEAKKEALMRMHEQNTTRRLPKVLRAGAIAAVLAVALAVTASAAGTDLLGFIGIELTTIFDDGFHQVAVDEDGNEWNTYDLTADTELRDGRLILKAMTQEFDITDDLQEDGEAVHTFTKDGQDLTVTVTGTLEEHLISSSSEMVGVAYESKPSSDTEAYCHTLITGPVSDDEDPGVMGAEAPVGVEESHSGSWEVSEDDAGLSVFVESSKPDDPDSPETSK